MSLLTLLTCMSCLADIRPEPFADRSSSLESQQALILLNDSANQMYLGEGGLENWLKQKSVLVKMTDTWFGVSGKMFCPHPDLHQELDFIFVPGQDDSVVEYYKEGQPTGQKKGIHEWNTWEQLPGQKWDYHQDEDIKFNLPTMQYFIEMPFRLPAGDAIRDYGDIREMDGRQYHVVYLTWGSYTPNDQNDQYIVYINPATGLIERVDYTVRDKAPFVKGSVFYNDYRKSGNYLLPHLIRIGDSNSTADALHEMKIESYELSFPVQKSRYAPDETIKASRKNQLD